MKTKSALLLLGLVPMLYAVSLYAQSSSADEKVKNRTRLPFDEGLEKQMPPSEHRRSLKNRRVFPHSNQPLHLSQPQSFSAGVQEAWVSRYASGLAPGFDAATDVAVDGSGNVYVTGYSTNQPFGLDYLTARYDAAGALIWTARYNGEGNGDDSAFSIAVDAAMNVYVTGESRVSGTSSDYATIKYNSAGVEQWVARYNGPGNFIDFANAIVVDGSGNVYVTGGSYGSGTEYDYATIKYNSAGVQQWVTRYNGPGNSADLATALAVDASGNVYATGQSIASGLNDDYATIKYNSAGVEQWVARYNGPGNSTDIANALAVDATGNVYVTGRSAGSGTFIDYATIKYNSAGLEQWVARYNDPKNSVDIANALAVDATGNVYVTGYSEGSGTSTDYATIKYNSAGAQQWVARYNGPGNSFDEANALAVDATGNVYVTGSSEGSGTAFDYATIKYNSAGVQQWVARYSSPGNSFDTASALAVDATGNVYVTGSSEDSGTSSDYSTIKYNSAGVEQWVARYNGPGNSADGATAIAVDGSGNVYVTGFSEGSGTDNDYATIKYDSAGVQQWVARYNGPGDSVDRANDLAVDATGNVYVTGRSKGSGTDDDYATIKYNSAGVQQWVARYNGPGNSTDLATALAIDASGNVYATGQSIASGRNNDYATIKYNAAGVQQWVARYNGPGNSFDIANAIAADDSGNVYVTGRSVGSGTDYAYATIKYDSAGVAQWVARYNTPGDSFDEAKALAVDATGDVYVTGPGGGTVFGTSTYTTIKYVQQVVNRSPGVANAIPRQTLVVDQVSFTRDLNVLPVVFNDPDGDSLAYSASSSNNAVAIARISGSVLTASAVASGDASIAVFAQDRGGGSKTTTFMVNVDTPPIVILANRLADINLTLGSGRTLVRDLQAPPFVFSDRDGDTLSFASTSSDSSIAVASISGNILYVLPVAVGAADITVEASDGKGGRAKAIFRVTVKEPQAAPAISPSSISSAQPEGQDIVINARITDNTAVASAYLYFRRGGERDFKPRIGLRPQGSANYSGTIQKDQVSSSGLEYYIEATDDEGLTARKPLSGVYAIRVDVAAPGLTKDEPQPGGSGLTDYRLISAPLDLKDKTPQAVLVDDLGEYKKNQWRFHELLADQSYVEYPNTSNVIPGKAFWLIVRQPDKRISTGAGVSIRSDTVFSIPLHPGWNFAGNPFSFSIPSRSIRFKNSEQPAVLRTYQGSWNDPINDAVEEMQPAEGYAISNDLGAPDTLLINPNLSDTTGILFKGLHTSREKNLQWSIHILSQCQEARDVDNHAAVFSRAAASWDEFDLPEPVAVIDEYLSVYFPHDDWNVPSKEYCIDARPEPSDGEIWEFAVTTNIRDKVNLTFAGLASVPKEFEVWLVDERLGITQNLREDNRYSVAGFEHPKSLKLVVGKRDFVEKKLANVQSIPVAYELQQNFPNPFNPATTIRYGLPKAERVTLTIYNLLGEEVIKLVDHAEKKAGYHVAIWDGRNRDGRLAASGVYIFRWRAGNVVMMKKMALVK